MQDGQKQAEPTEQSAQDRLSGQPPVVWRELLAILLLIVLCDLTIYRGHGFAGLALLFAAAPVLLLLGTHRPRRNLATWIVSVMLVVLACKLLWCGNVLLVAMGFCLLVAFAASVSGQIPYVLTVTVVATQTVRAGYEALQHYERSLRVPLPRMRWLNILLPLGALLVYGIIFILANPHVVAFVSDAAEMFFRDVRQWLLLLSPFEFAFWVGVLWISAGLLRPDMGHVNNDEAIEQDAIAPDLPPEPAPVYPAFRNTLLTVIALFAVYLVFEFNTLWFREFPEGFYYSGYAHEGAAWLTFALALATVTLSVILRGSIRRDPRCGRLRALAWVWSLQNLILAAAVFNRLWIYVGFNGMTRMRIVAFFGISTVVVGFVLVLWKIQYNRSFVWLIRRHLWTLAIAVYLFALTPVDAFVVKYNVGRILAGDPAPSVEITEHPIGSEGLLLLKPLLDCDDDVIREGIGAMLSEREAKAEDLAQRKKTLGWTTWQLADRMVLDDLRASHDKWAEFTSDPVKRAKAMERFQEYAYQWY